MCVSWTVKHVDTDKKGLIADYVFGIHSAFVSYIFILCLKKDVQILLFGKTL